MFSSPMVLIVGLFTSGSFLASVVCLLQEASSRRQPRYSLALGFAFCSGCV